MLILATAAMAAPPSVDTPLKTGARAPDAAAVVIGIEDYAFVPDVPYATRDAAAVRDFLVYTHGMAPARVELLPPTANRELILEAAERAADRAGPDGAVWLYFAGHGAADPSTGEHLLLGVDVQARPEAFRARAVTVAELEEAAGAAGAEVVSILDTCWSGVGRSGESLAGGTRFAVPTYALPERGQVVRWTATAPDQLSHPLPAAEHGAFTYFALGAMRGWADGALGEPDGTVTLEEAQEYVARALRTSEVGTQTPEVTGTADTVLAASKKLERIELDDRQVRAWGAVALPAVGTAPAAPAVDPCARPEWMDTPGSGAVVGDGSRWPDPRLGLLGGAVAARRELAYGGGGKGLSEVAKELADQTSDAPSAPVTQQMGKSHISEVILNTQVTGRWTDCEAHTTFVRVERVPAGEPPTSAEALSSRVEEALGPASPRPAWVDGAPLVPGVVLGLGIGADAHEARDVAVTELALATHAEVSSMMKQFEEITTAGPTAVQVQLATKITAYAPTSCAVPVAVAATWTDADGWHHALVAAPAGTVERTARCTEAAKAGRAEAEERARAHMTRAAGLARLSPTQARGAYAQALEGFRSIGGAVLAREFLEVSIDASDATQGQTLVFASQPGALACDLQFDGALEAPVAALAGAAPTPLDEAGVCAGPTVPELAGQDEGGRTLEAVDARKGAR